MKIRKSFVTNSSSTSYCILGIDFSSDNKQQVLGIIVGKEKLHEAFVNYGKKFGYDCQNAQINDDYIEKFEDNWSDFIEGYVNENLLEEYYLETDCPDGGDSPFIIGVGLLGLSLTNGQSKLDAAKKLQEIFPAKKVCTHSESWYNG